MSAQTALEMMATYPPAIAATKKLKAPPLDGFVWYAYEWLGDSPDDWDVMKVEGAMTRIAKAGKNKGEPIICRGQGKMTVYITAAEIKEAAHGITSGEATKKGGAA